MMRMGRMLSISAACGCDIGRIRKRNEDNFYFNKIMLEPGNTGLPCTLEFSSTLERPICFGLFDGMGGEACGAEASYLAAMTLSSIIETMPTSRLDLGQVCMKANRKICRWAQEHSVGRMGSTAILMQFDGSKVELANLGDSKAYLLRKRDFRQISVDHTEEALMKLHGVTGRKPRLTQHLGIEESEMIIEPFTLNMDIYPEDRFLLCSDGLTDMVSSDVICSLLERDLPPAVIVEELIRSALSNGGRDNITVIVCLVCKRN